MRYIFFGTPHIAAVLLRRLLDNKMPPVALVANPDRPAGRKKIMTPPETKQLLSGFADLNIPVFQPEKIKDMVPDLMALAPDLGIVLAYGKILPKEILDIPKLGTIGVHPSLLPKYRGPSPIQSALLSNEPETGVALYRMGIGLDDGPVYAAEKIATADLTHEELAEALANLAADMLSKLLPQVESGSAEPIPQNEAEATYTNKFTSADGFVEEADLRAAQSGDAEKAREIYGKIRAFTPEPGAWTLIGGRRMKLLRAKIDGSKLELITVQYEGKTPEAYRN